MTERLMLVWAGDGPVLIPHTEQEWARFWAGVDEEASVLAVAPLEDDED